MAVRVARVPATVPLLGDGELPHEAEELHVDVPVVADDVGEGHRDDLEALRAGMTPCGPRG